MGQVHRMQTPLAVELEEAEALVLKARERFESALLRTAETVDGNVAEYVKAVSEGVQWLDWASEKAKAARAALPESAFGMPDTARDHA